MLIMSLCQSEQHNESRRPFLHCLRQGRSCKLGLLREKTMSAKEKRIFRSQELVNTCGATASSISSGTTTQ